MGRKTANRLPAVAPELRKGVQNFLQGKAFCSRTFSSG